MTYATCAPVGCWLVVVLAEVQGAGFPVLFVVGGAAPELCSVVDTRGTLFWVWCWCWL